MRRYFPLLIVFATLGSLAAPAAQAQIQFNGRQQYEQGTIFSPAPRELRQRIKYAKEALDAGRYTEASSLLGTLVAGRLEDVDNQDYFMEVENDPQRMVSIKAEAQRLIGTMPAGGREVYELQFGAEAQQLLTNALAKGDVQELAEVTRLFFHTDAGYEASLLLGRYYLDRGKPLAAALTLQNLAQYPAAASRFDPDLSILLATCWMLSDMPERARATLADLRQRQPKAELHVQGIAAQLPASDADLLPWLEKQIGGQLEFNRLAAEQWAMHRGEPGRNAESNGGAPVFHARWAATLNSAAEEEELIRKIQEEDFLAQQLAPLPVMQPLAVGETIMVRTPSYLVGIDFRSGKRVWTFPWDEAANMEISQAPGANAVQGVEQRREQLKQRLFADSPYGQLASDGKSVFLLDDLGFAAIGVRSHFIRPGGVREQNPYWGTDTNQLLALDIAREGALKWTVGGQTGEDEPQLAGAFFLGPPLPLMGQLYVMAELNGEMRIVVLDAETGRYQWSQQLAVVGQQNIMGDQTRRLAGASPSFADGVLVCPTSAGAVVAVDISTRTLLWGFTYRSNNVRERLPRGEETEEQSWADATVAISGGKVIVTPKESDQVYCLNLLSGKPLWARNRGDLMYHACNHEDAGVFVGNDRVTAFRLDDGAPAWANDLMLDSLPSGRGFYSGDHYYLPTVDGRLLKIDLHTGELVQSYETEHALGNVVCYRDQLISLTPFALETYYQAEPLRALVDERLKENPDDPDALAQHAELLMQDGNQAQALEELQRAWRIAPQNFRVSRLLSKSILSVLRTDFVKYRATALELESLIDNAQRGQYLRLMAAGYRDAGESAKAFERYMELAGELKESASASPLHAMEDAGRLYQVRRDRWLQAQLRDLLSRADDKDRLAIEGQIQSKIDAALQADTLASLRQADELFGFTEASEQIRLRLADSLRRASYLLEAEVILIHLQRSSDPAIAVEAALQLADMLEEAGKPSAALRQYRWIASRYQDQPLRGALTGGDLLAAFQERQAGEPLLSQPGNWPNGKATAALDNTRSVRRPSYQRVYPIALRNQRGPSPVSMQVAYDQAQNDVVVTSGWGHELQRASLNRTDGRKFYLSNYNVTSYDSLGHLVIASIGSELVAIDTLAPLRTDELDNSALLWRHDAYHAVDNTIRVTTKGLENPWGTARFVGIDTAGRRVGVAGPVTRMGVCVQRMSEVACLDPLTGETIWSRRDVEPGSDLFGDEQYVFVVPPKGPARIFNMLDGSEAGARELPNESQRWFSVGRKLLCWKRERSQPQEPQMGIYLLDALTGQSDWSRAFPLGTKATIIDNDEVALLTPEGKLEIIRMADGQSRISLTVELDAPLTSFYVMRSSQEYIVAAGLQRPRPGANNTNIQPQPSSLYSPLIDGKIWCLERESGSLRWQSPADIHQFSLPLDQPLETPVLVFLRQINTLTANGTRRSDCSVLVLDKRDGRQIFAHDEISTQAYTYSLFGDPALGRVTLELPGYQVQIDYSDEPRPPEPPVQAGLAEAQGPESGGTVGAIIGEVKPLQRPAAIIRAIAPRPPAPPR